MLSYIFFSIEGMIHLVLNWVTLHALTRKQFAYCCFNFNFLFKTGILCRNSLVCSKSVINEEVSHFELDGLCCKKTRGIQIVQNLLCVASQLFNHNPSRSLLCQEMIHAGKTRVVCTRQVQRNTPTKQMPHCIVNESCFNNSSMGFMLPEQSCFQTCYI